MTHLLLKGGLGNQLFQLSAAMSLSSAEIHLLISPEQKEQLLLDQFLVPSSNLIKSVKVSGLTEKLLNASLGISGAENTGSIRFQRRMLSSLLLKVMPDVESVHISTGLGFSNVSQSFGEMLLVGYFQSYRYIADTKVHSLLMSLRPKRVSSEFEYFSKIAGNTEILVVHVRRGDYRKENTFGLLSRDYYRKAIELATQQKKYDEIWIFSDELQSAREIVPKDFHKNLRYPEEMIHDRSETFELMRLGSGYVIANSSFSWWAATLSKSPNCHVISPTPWFSGRPSPSDLYPKNWMLVGSEFE